MRGRREQRPALSPRARWTAGFTGLAVAGTAVAIALVPAGTANAKPSANYHPGSDKAVFTVTGVEDSNCLVSTGGSTIYIKPGDRIDFSSALAGVALNGLDLQGGQIAGLNVTGKIDGGAKKGGQNLSVPGGKTVKVRNLSKGTHTLTWTAKSVKVTVPKTVKTITKKVLGPLGGLITKILHKTIPAHLLTIPLSSSQLKSGATLSWAGKIYVTNSAAQCTISVQTPKTKISAGPIHATVPGQNVTVPGATVPTKITGIPSLGPTGSAKPSTTAPKKTHSSAAPSYQAPSLTVPQMVVPQGDGGSVYNGGGYDLGLGTDNGKTSKLHVGNGGGSSTTTSAAGSTTSTAKNVTGSGRKKTVDLASNQSGSSVSGELPVLLAIIAVIVLAMVAGTYARLYLLGRRK
ncbi:hypothetical protein [Jatrophihabitans endophyticus]|uniref:hypothetical protein n=1 Tax=Jatrophihabitans endophyticus TaxID=1206085 RepID=UPI0019FDACB6|nr:hypothetical protein [Jatrophihabitans endophyticus]MBE7189174.1 hypothetical protein [Jatrophihabitans endophyticus]